MYPHHVFDLEPTGTFGMYPICYWQVSGRYFQPEPAMYSRCFHWFPGPLAPSVRAMVDMTMCHFPLFSKDDIVFLDGVLDHIGGCQYLLSMLLGVGLNTMDLCHMSPPFHLSIIHLQRHWGRGGLETNENILSTLQALVESTCHLLANNRLGTFQMFLQVPGQTHDVGTFMEHFECNINMCNTFDPP